MKVHKRKDGSKYFTERGEYGTWLEEDVDKRLQEEKQKLKQLEQTLEKVSKVVVLENSVEKT